MNPKALKKGLQVKEVGAEVVVFDKFSSKVYRLNATPAFVWRNCSGARTPSQIAALLNTPNAEEVVRMAIAELTGAGLLEGAPINAAGVSRRQFVTRLGLAASAAIALPVIDSLVVPAQAQEGRCFGRHNTSALGAISTTRGQAAASVYDAAYAK